MELVPVIAGINTICAGLNTVFDADSGYSGYLWSDGTIAQTINVSVGGIYTVTVTDANGCTGSASQSLIVNPNPSPAISGVNSICLGTNSVFDAGAGYTTYNWTGGNSNQTLNVSIAGTYTVTVTDAGGCTGTTSLDLFVNPIPTSES